MKTRLIIEVSVILKLSSCQIKVMGSSSVQGLLFFRLPSTTAKSRSLKKIKDNVFYGWGSFRKLEVELV